MSPFGSLNVPAETKVALVGVSRDCFPRELTRDRRGVLAQACEKAGVDVFLPKSILEGEWDIKQILEEVRQADCDAMAIYLGNFGPEGPLALLAKRFGGPVMLCGAAEGDGDLINGRGDAFCGMLNASLAAQLHNLRVHLPKVPVGTPNQLAADIGHFAKVARVVNAVRALKVISFGPRPQDFYACNAPIAPLYDLGIGVMENSELDLLAAYQNVDDRELDVTQVIVDMVGELGLQSNYDTQLFTKMARFEVALVRLWGANKGAYSYAVFANKCWPAFEKFFGFVPCFVNSRLASRGIPVACEVDIYGAVSEYLVMLASDHPATLLDINNTVPRNVYDGQDLRGVNPEDLFMGFHCGNTPSCCMKNFDLKHQLIMHRLMETGHDPDITRGTLEGQIAPSQTTLFRLQANLSSRLMAYIAEGEILDIDPQSFGGIGVVGIHGFQRFYRNVLLEWGFPHHGAFGFQPCGRILFDALKLMGMSAIATPLTPNEQYRLENPFGE